MVCRLLHASLGRDTLAVGCAVLVFIFTSCPRSSAADLLFLCLYLAKAGRVDAAMHMHVLPSKIHVP